MPQESKLSLPGFELVLVVDNFRQLRGTHGSVVSRMGEENAPGISEPFVEANMALSRLSLKIGEFLAEFRHFGRCQWQRERISEI